MNRVLFERVVGLVRALMLLICAYLFYAGLIPSQARPAILLYALSPLLSLWVPRQGFWGGSALLVFDSASLGAVIYSASTQKLLFDPRLFYLYFFWQIAQFYLLHGAMGSFLSTVVSATVLLGVSLTLLDSPSLLAETALLSGFMTLGAAFGAAGFRRTQQAHEQALSQKEDQIRKLSLELEGMRCKVKEETVRDAVTGLFNQKYFRYQLKEEIPKAMRHKFQFAVVAIGLDYFKSFNQSYGEKKGDEALKIVGTLLAAYTRNSDLLCRMDKRDGYLVIFPYTVGEQAMIPLKRFQEAVRKYRFDDKNPNARLTVSCGVAVFPDHGTKEDELIERSLIALKRAKGQGRDRLCLYG